MKEVQLSKAKEHLGSLVQEVQSTHSTIGFTRYGERVAVLVSAGDFDEMQRAQDAVKVVQIREALDGPTYDLGEVLEELGIA